MQGKQEHPSGQRRTVLIVVDDPAARLLLEREVHALGHDVVTDDDAESAREGMTRTDFALVIMDTSIGGESGLQLGRSVKSHYPDTEAVVVASLATIETATEALRLGARDYLVAPFDNLPRRAGDKRLRTICFSHAALGWLVTPAMWTRRVPMSMTKKTK